MSNVTTKHSFGSALFCFVTYLRIIKSSTDFCLYVYFGEALNIYTMTPNVKSPLTVFKNIS